jgi:rod shape-determining protein MreB
VYVRGQGIVLDEPSVVAVNTKDNRPLAVGTDAKRMVGRTPPHIQPIRPLKDGVIADFDMCEQMLRYFIEQVHQRRWAKPRMVICVPSGITGVEQRAVQEAAEYAGARKPAYIIEEPMAAAIGAGLPVHEPTGNMVVDIGGGTTEVAVISLGGVVASESVRVAGDEIDEALISFCKKEYSLALGERTAEDLKAQLASAWPLEEELYAEIRGRDLVSGLPKTIVVSTVELREAIEEPIQAICDAIKYTLDRTPPELAADMMEKGIVITGGGSLLHGLAARLAAETGMPVRRAKHPLYTVVLGSGQCLDEFDGLRALLLAS